MVRSKSRAELMARGRMAIGLTNVDLAEQLGVSRRTVQRWLAGHTSIVPAELAALAALVLPHDRALAEEIALGAESTLEGLGLVQPAPPPTPPAPTPAASPPPTVNLVVYAAAEAMDQSPRALRPALLAAFRCARQLGLGVEDVEKALGAVAEP